MRFLLCLGLLVLGTGIARADPETLYVGAGVSYDRYIDFGRQVNPDEPGAYSDISAASWKALVGVRPLQWFAVEAEYFATASATNSSAGTRSEARAIAAEGVFLTGKENFDAFFKAGIGHCILSSGTGGDLASGACPVAGAGMQWHFGRVGVRLEYELLPSTAVSNGLHAVSLGVLLNLL